RSDGQNQRFPQALDLPRLDFVPPNTASLYPKNTDLFEMIEKMQTEEDYIPYPSVHEFGGYWIEGTNHEITSIPETEPLQSPTTKVKLECNPTARIYRKHFLGKEHFNYYSLDTALGHLVFSLKYDVIGDQEHLRLLLRTKCRTYHDVIPISCLTEFPNVVQMAKVRPLLLHSGPPWAPQVGTRPGCSFGLSTLASVAPGPGPACCSPVSEVLPLMCPHDIHTLMCSGALSPICVLLDLFRVPLVLQFSVPHSEQE
ncbi:Rap1 GTPase-activating protein 1, partial [Pteropus alecto]